MICRFIGKPVRTFWLTIIVVLALQSCDQRFSKAPIRNLNSKTESVNESIVVLEGSFKSFDIDELVQYLKLHEETQWVNISIKEIEECLDLFENNYLILELASDFYLSRDSLDVALLYNSKAEENGARSTEFYKKRANIFAALGQNGLAIDYINKAVTINGNDPDIYLTKGKVYLNMGDSNSALLYKEQAYSNDSSRKDIAFDLAHLYANAGKNKKARQLTNLLIEQKYKARDVNSLNVTLFRNELRNEEANQLLVNMLDSGDIKAGEELIDYFNKQNQYDSIIRYAIKLLDQDSLNIIAIEAKARSFDQKGYFTSALMYYNQLLAIDSLNEEALDGIRKVNGKIAYLRKLREQREAIPTFDFASPRKETN